MSEKAQTPSVDPDRIQHLDPTTLILDLDSNVRVSTKTEQSFLDSIRELGVEQPITAVLTAAGTVRVETGHRRTLAAIAVGRKTVPVRITAKEATTKAGKAARIVRQMDENECRAGLTMADRVKVAVQLTALDMKPEQVARKMRRTGAEVEAALAVAASQTAQAVAVRYDFLDLLQGAVVAEFEGNPEAVKALVAAAKTGQFDHVAQQLRDERAEEEAKEAVAAQLREAGITVIERTRFGAEPFKRLERLLDPTTGEPLTAETHAQCPGHAAFVQQEWVQGKRREDDEDREAQGDEGDEGEHDECEDDEYEDGHFEWVPVFVCLDHMKHGHLDRWARAETGGSAAPAAQTPEEQEAHREARSAERRDVIASNKAWRSAETVRRNWLHGLVDRKTAPKGAAAFLAVAQAAEPELLAQIKGNHYAAELLGLTGAGYGVSTEFREAVIAAPANRVQLLHLILTLAAYEMNTSTSDWRNRRPATRRYLTYLESIGYKLSPVEERTLGRRDDLEE